MCTVTWTRSSPTHRSLVCNRDEQRSRPPAAPPSVRQINGVRVLTPTDPQAGGTWLFVNETGLVGTLLNFYDATPAPSGRPAEGYQSRGLLLLSLGDCRDAGQAHDRLVIAVKEAAFAPFWILIMRRDEPLRRWRWDGHSLQSTEVADSVQPVTTSSWQTPEVLAERARYFGEQSPSTAHDLEAYHRSCSPKGGPWGPCMARPDARTVSLSRIDLAPEGIHFAYQERKPDDKGFSPPHHANLPWHPDHRP